MCLFLLLLRDFFYLPTTSLYSVQTSRQFLACFHAVNIYLSLSYLVLTSSQQPNIRVLLTPEKNAHDLHLPVKCQPFYVRAAHQRTHSTLMHHVREVSELYTVMQMIVQIEVMFILQSFEFAPVYILFGNVIFAVSIMLQTFYYNPNGEAAAYGRCH